MQKIAALGAIYKNQNKAVNNSGIAKSIKSLSDKAGNERDSIVDRPNEPDVFLSLFNTKALDVRNFSTDTKTLSQNDVNNIWQSNSNSINIASKSLTTNNAIAEGTYNNNSNDRSISNHNLNFDNSINPGGFINSDKGGEGRSFHGIPNDGNSDPLYNAAKHSKEENEKISNMMTIMNSSSSSETSKADSMNGEKFTKSFTESILSGNSLQETIKMLDGKNLGGQTSQAYNTENMSQDEISAKNKAHGTAIILRGSNDGVASMMARDEENVTKAYKELGLDVKVTHSEKEFETALMAARDQAITDKAAGKESILATHVISHGFQAGSAGGHNNENSSGALAMQGGGAYHEKDIIGDIAGALEKDKDGNDPFKHSYNSFTACHSGSMDNKQALAENNGQESASPQANNQNNSENQVTQNQANTETQKQEQAA